jgi:uncharacterized protein YbbC (DUF1343 family)
LKRKILIIILFVTIATLFGCGNSVAQTGSVPIPAADRSELYLHLLTGRNVAFVGNQTSVLVDGSHVVDFLVESGVRVVKIFAPEHGFRDMADDGVAIKHGLDPVTKIPVVSLYGGGTSKPTPQQLTDVDVVVFDIQDVGCRFYTYINTLQHIMEAGAENSIPIIVLDRPNPNGFFVDGPVLEVEAKSGIGYQPVPIVYGMTIGEYALMLNGEGWLAGGAKCELTVIPLQNWDHNSRYSLPVMPSPNLPNDKAVNLYASLCLFEGTNFSEGRGTEWPFQVFGSPAVDSTKTDFWFTPRPSFGSSKPKLEGEKCWGLDLRSVSEQSEVNLDWILWAYQNTTDRVNFFLSNRPEKGSRAFAIRAGNYELQRQIEAGMSSLEIRTTWQPGLERFKKIRTKYLLYKDF